MNQVNCPVCGSKCIKNGKTHSGSQRWLCKKRKIVFTQKLDHEAKDLQVFLKWLFSKQTLSEMPGGGRNFRRRTSKFWSIWTMPPKVEEQRDVLFVGGVNPVSLTWKNGDLVYNSAGKFYQIKDSRTVNW